MRSLPYPRAQISFLCWKYRQAEGRTFGSEDIQNGCTLSLAHSFLADRLAAATGIVGSTLTSAASLALSSA